MNENTLRHTGESKSAIHESSNSFAYNDGDDIEDYLLKVISEAQDISLGSRELAGAICDWPSEYHLSPIRGNLLKGFQFRPGDKVLEIGAGCGAITRLLGEAGLSVTAVEGSSRRSKIASARCRDLKDVEIVTTNISNFKSTKKFDYIFLIGVLEYAPSFIQSDDPIHELLSICKSFLKQGGTLIIAIENRLGLKYLNGAPEDHIGQPYWGIQDLYINNSAVTFGRKELGSRLSKVGLSNIEHYFPFPDYKLPEVLISERALTNSKFCPGELLHQNYSSGNGQSYLASFDEPLTWSIIGKNGLIAELANSFLIFASEKTQTSGDWLAKIFSCREITITFEVNEHEEICVKKSSPQVINSGPFRIHSEIAPYITGQHYHNDLRRILMRGEGVQEIANWLQPWFKLLCASASLESEITEGVLPNDFVDCVPHNIIISSSGELEYIDKEWIGVEKPPFAWIFARGVLHSIWRCGWKGALVEYTYREAITELGSLLGFRLEDRHFDLAQKLESQFLQVISGRQITSPLPFDVKIESTVHYWKKNYTSQLNLLSQAKLEIDFRDAQLDELKGVEKAHEALIVERDSLAAERDALNETVRTQSEQFKAEQLQNSQTKAANEEQISTLISELKNTHTQLSQIFSSKSWKVTAPFRKSISSITSIKNRSNKLGN